MYVSEGASAFSSIWTSSEKKKKIIKSRFCRGNVKSSQDDKITKYFKTYKSHKKLMTGI